MPTIKDVARECGVSANTVSSVLNNKAGEVSAKTRERILDAIRRLEYRPNATARRMVGKRLDTLGIADRYVDSTGRGNFYKTTILESIMFAARRARWDILYYSGHPSEEQVGNFPAYLDGRCDGLICFTGGIDHEETSTIVRTGLPVVFVGEIRHHLGGAVIDVDNEAGAYQAVKHLTELGHTRIGLLESPVTSGNAERVAGYHRALAEANIAADETLRYTLTPWEGAGREVGHRIFSLPLDQQPTAIFCFNDGVAVGVLKAAEELGVRVPEQVSVVGFDDIISASMTTPTLTTVRQPLQTIGERSVEVLLGIIDGTLPRDFREIMPAELVVRQSSAPPLPR